MFFNNSLTTLKHSQIVEKKTLVLMRMMSDYLSGAFNVASDEPFNLVRFEEDIQK